MRNSPPESHKSDETDEDRLRRILDPDALSIRLVSALAGERPLTPAETTDVDRLWSLRGNLFYSDLIFAVTHQFFPPESAEILWKEILRHRHEMEFTLDRGVTVVVAALDYFANFKPDIHSQTLVTETHIAQIVNRSMRDGLTGLFNHNSFFEILDLELKCCARYGSVMSLIMADIDNFKAVNDLHGHPEGDRVLQKLAAAIATGTRDSDIGCRFGGEEFAVILPQTDIKEAVAIAERIREEAAKLAVGEIPVTISLGVTSYDTTISSAMELLKRADRALYVAKKSGKNKVVVLDR